jgi:hypothetical protein
MVWPITAAESYVRETGKSMKRRRLAITRPYNLAALRQQVDREDYLVMELGELRGVEIAAIRTIRKRGESLRKNWNLPRATGNEILPSVPGFQEAGSMRDANISDGMIGSLRLRSKHNSS